MHYAIVCIRGHQPRQPGIWHVIENSTNCDIIVGKYRRRKDAVEAMTKLTEENHVAG